VSGLGLPVTVVLTAGQAADVKQAEKLMEGVPAAVVIGDKGRYKDRNLVERFFSKLKQYRRVATRYEKTARNFLAFVHVASIMILLR
jgi:transposase